MPWQKRRAQQQARTSTRLKPQDYGDEDDDDDDMEQDTMMDKPTREAGPIVEADLEDYAKITLPRRRLARWCKEPFFKGAIMNCFVRLLIGYHDGKRCYRLCQIVDVKKGKKNYNFPPANPREKPVSTLYLLC
jgi:RNA polymerase-associated protein RTF1